MCHHSNPVDWCREKWDIRLLPRRLSSWLPLWRLIMTVMIGERGNFIENFYYKNEVLQRYSGSDEEILKYIEDSDPQNCETNLKIEFTIYNSVEPTPFYFIIEILQISTWVCCIARQKSQIGRNSGIIWTAWAVWDGILLWEQKLTKCIKIWQFDWLLKNSE